MNYNNGDFEAWYKFAIWVVCTLLEGREMTVLFLFIVYNK